MVRKMPPLEKVYEAFSAIGDERIRLEDNAYTVYSSDKSKYYTVTEKDNVYRSDDNATYWQGYPGYPVIAVLILQGKLPYNREVCEEMKGIPWKVLNDKYRRDYAAAAEEALRGLGTDSQKIREEAQKVYDALQELDIETGRGKRKKG